MQVNIYVFYLCYMYAPTKEVQQEQQDYQNLQDMDALITHFDEDLQSVKIDMRTEYLDIEED